VTQGQARTIASTKLAVIDAHHHLWDLKAVPHSWLSEPSELSPLGDLRRLSSDYLPAEYLAEASCVDLLASVHIQGEADDHLLETRWLNDQAERAGCPTVIVAGARLDLSSGAELIESYAEMKRVHGVRQLLNWHPDPARSSAPRPDLLTDPLLRENLERLTRLGLSFDLSLYPFQLPLAVGLIERLEATRFIVNHALLPYDRSDPGMEKWRSALSALGQCENVFIKLSGLGMFDHDWTAQSALGIAEEVFRAFGEERVMFGSNFPVDRLYSSFETLVERHRAIVRSLGVDERAYFVENARYSYRVELGAAA
jgi:predicted TIM-barrel fold metal-dependent hydrolase